MPINVEEDTPDKKVMISFVQELRRAAQADRVFVPLPFAAEGSEAQPPLRGPRVEDEAMKANDVYIGRGTARLGLSPSMWQNGQRIDKKVNRKQAVESFRSALRASGVLQRALVELAGRRLRCHCHRGLSCHGDVIIEQFLKAKKRDPRTKSPTFFEIFAGHGGLSAAVKERGFVTCSVDWSGNRHRAKVSILILDLTVDEDFLTLLARLSACATVFLWLAPPCGTFSEARLIPIPAHLLRI